FPRQQCSFPRKKGARDLWPRGTYPLSIGASAPGAEAWGVTTRWPRGMTVGHLATRSDRNGSGCHPRRPAPRLFRNRLRRRAPAATSATAIASWPQPLHPQQAAGVRVAGGGIPVGAGSDAGQRDQVAPAESRPGGREFLRHRAVELLAVQGAVLADRV